jgi:tRNA (cytidine/uridine-2'-O-)-methyltransferase
MHVVLVEPEIPPNTGNVARLCAATRSSLHLIEPLGFRLNDRELRRAGMDYWNNVQWRSWTDWPTFMIGSGLTSVTTTPPLPTLLAPPKAQGDTTLSLPKSHRAQTLSIPVPDSPHEPETKLRPRFWLVEQNGAHQYDQVRFQSEDYLVFGRETRGLPQALLNAYPDRVISIPILNPSARSLNLSNAVAIVLFEALRQQNFAASLQP